MIFKNNKPIKRPEKEKKFSFKNPADKAIFFSLLLLLLLVAVIIICVVIFGGLLP